MTELLDFLDETYGERDEKNDRKAVDLVLYPPVSPSHYSGRREMVTNPSSDSEDGQLFAKPSKSKKKKQDERKNQKEVRRKSRQATSGRLDTATLRHCDLFPRKLDQHRE